MGQDETTRPDLKDFQSTSNAEDLGIAGEPLFFFFQPKIFLVWGLPHRVTLTL